MIKKLGVIGLTGCMILSLAACGSNQASNNASTSTKEEAIEKHKIGVAVYSSDDDEVVMFRDYYKGYIENAFDVEFIYSDALRDIEAEKEFIDQAREEGCEGIISYVSYDLPEIVNYCSDMYYAVGSTTFSEDDYNAVKNNENFIGIMSPSSEDEYNAGVNMVKTLGKEDGQGKNWVLLSGGAVSGNYMHSQRLKGMLDTLEKEYGFTLCANSEELLTTSENLLIGENKDGGKIYISPGYYMLDDSKDMAVDAINNSDTDIIASVCSIQSILEDITLAENSMGKDIRIGTVDCFSSSNAEAINTLDAFGSNTLDFVEGKCQAMAAPSFVAIYNAITGNETITRDNGQAFWLNQGFWSASNPEEYNAMTERADNIYNNIYGSKDMMNVMGIYNENASFDDFKTFVSKIDQQ